VHARECYTHAQACGGGVGVFLLLRSSMVQTQLKPALAVPRAVPQNAPQRAWSVVEWQVLLLREERSCVWPSLYLDRHGEEDENLQRGKPLFLSADRYQQLTSTVMGTFTALSVNQARDGTAY
jgi:hypothetical protein